MNADHSAIHCPTRHSHLTDPGSGFYNTQPDSEEEK